MNLNLLSLITVMGATQGLLLSFILFQRYKAGKRSNIYLTVLIALLSLEMMNGFLEYTGMIYRTPHLLAITDPFNLLYGPLFLFYIFQLTRPRFQLKARDAIHLLPCLIYLLRIYPIYFLSTDEKLKHLQFFYEDTELTNPWGTNFIIMLVMGGYLFYGFFCFLKFYRNYFIGFSSKEKKQWKLTLLVITGITAIYGIYAFRVIFAFGGISMIENLALAFLFYALAYLVLREGENLFHIQIRVEPSEKTISTDQQLLEKLEQLMQEQKPYLDPKLSLSLLALPLGVSPQVLSRVINQHHKQNFFNYINRWRVKEAKSLLLDIEQKQYTLEKIGMDAGFQSKSSFYTAFKKFTSLTPNAFRTEQGD